MGLLTWVSPLDFTPTASHSLWISGTMTEGDRRMDWKTLLACITGSVEEQLLLRNEYVVEENRILRNQIVSWWSRGGCVPGSNSRVGITGSPAIWGVEHETCKIPD